MGDKALLKYEDIILRDSDVDTLRGPCFLNDNIIAFYLSYLFKSGKIKTDDVLFVQPAMSLWVANCQDDSFVEEFARSCKLSSKRLVLFVVNDNDDFDGGDSGNHWSILVYDRTMNSFLHYDSMEGVNSFHATKLYDAIKEYMGPGGGGGGGDVSSPSSSSLKKKRNKKKSTQSASKPLAGAKPEPVAAAAEPAGLPKFVECKTPQQSNGYDCGLYVLAIARVIAQWCTDEHRKASVVSVIENHVDDSVELNMRSEVLEIIQELSKD